MNFSQDVKTLLQCQIKGARSPEVQAKLSLNRVLYMDFLKKRSLEIFKKQITEWYARNVQVGQIIDLPRFLGAIKTIDTGAWSFDVIIDESDLFFYAQNKTGHKAGVGEGLDKYRTSSIPEIIDNKYFAIEAERNMENFIQIEFPRYVAKIIERR